MAAGWHGGEVVGQWFDSAVFPSDHFQMSTCRFCNWIRRRLCVACGDYWTSLYDAWTRWDRNASNEWELWEANSVVHIERLDAAHELESSDPAAALAIYTDVAEAGSVWAMEQAGRFHAAGFGTAADFELAQQWYLRAIGAGSWYATIRHARLLNRHGRAEHCRQVLQGGVDADYVPAQYWLARLTYFANPTRLTARRIASLLEQAVIAGHPGARHLQIHLMLRGKLGLRNIWRGLGAALTYCRDFGCNPEPRSGKHDDASSIA
ncbi:MAG: hypothetical protein ABIT10_08080 [Alteraurantiacibacter sp.]